MIDPKLKTLMLTKIGRYVIGVHGGKHIDVEVKPSGIEDDAGNDIGFSQYVTIDPDKVTSIGMYDPMGAYSKVENPIWLPYFPNAAKTAKT